MYWCLNHGSGCWSSGCGVHGCLEGGWNAWVCMNVE
jgi:hypothetical protein